MRPSIGAVLAQSYDNVDRNAYSPAASTPTAGRVVVAAIQNSKSAGTADTPSLINGTGWASGLTWTQIDSQAGGVARITWFWAVVPMSPTSGAFTIDFGGVTQSGCAWIIFEVVNLRTDVPVEQTKNGNGTGVTSQTVTLNRNVKPGNAVFAAFRHAAAEGVTLGTGFTQVGATQSGGTPATSFAVEWIEPGQTGASMSWTSSSNSIGLVVELRTLAESVGMIRA